MILESVRSVGVGMACYDRSGSGVLQPLKRLYVSAHEAANQLNRRNILECVARAYRAGARSEVRLLDLGCDDGSWTLQVGAAARASEVHGVEVVPSAAAAARDRGVIVHEADLNGTFPIEPDSVDVVHSNQVIEHVSDVDLFVSEIYRILKPGGTAVISTENGSSWHNIFAAILGWQVFSLTNVSGKVAGLGNPLAVHRDAAAFSPTWRHKTIMNYLGLKELFEVHGFRAVRVVGAGYYPLPARIGKWDVRHSAFITVKAMK